MTQLNGAHLPPVEVGEAVQRCSLTLPRGRACRVACVLRIDASLQRAADVPRLGPCGLENDAASRSAYSRLLVVDLAGTTETASSA